MKRSPLALLLSACLLLGGCAGGDVVATVGGYPVSLEEYRAYAYDEIALVSADYSREWGADPNAADFWTTAWDGRTPMQELLARADDAMARGKGMQALAVELGLMSREEIGWEGQSAAFEAENEARRDTLAQGGVVYGPQQLTQAQFSSYWQSAVEQAVEDALYLDAEPTEAQLLACYEEREAELSARNFTAQADFYFWPAGSAPDGAGEELARVLGEGLRGQEAADALAARLGVEAQWRSETVDTREMGKENDAYTDVVRLIAGCADGELAGSLTAEGMEVWVVPESRRNEGIGTFEEARSEIEDLWRTEEAARRIEEYLAGLEVVTTPRHDSLTIDEIRGSLSG